MAAGLRGSSPSALRSAEIALSSALSLTKVCVPHVLDDLVVAEYFTGMPGEVDEQVHDPGLEVYLGAVSGNDVARPADLPSGDFEFPRVYGHVPLI